MTGFDLITLLALAIAVVVFFRLRSVLGRRTGNERPPSNPYSRGPFQRAPGDAKPGRGKDEDNVIHLPGSDKPAGEEAPRREYAPAGTPLAAALTRIAMADRGFDPDAFLEGAKSAHEMIVTAFATGDRKLLRQLCDPEVYKDFEGAIAAREEKGQHLEQSYVGLSAAEITDAALEDAQARVTVRFVSEMITALRDADGEVVEGSPEAVRPSTDVWTFERDTRSRDPNWKLVATGAA